MKFLNEQHILNQVPLFVGNIYYQLVVLRNKSAIFYIVATSE